MAEIVLECRGIVKRFDQKTVVNKVSLQIKTGEIFGLLGSNGAGKTTLTKILTGFEKPNAGQIFFFGEEQHGISAKTKRHLGLVPQQNSYYPFLTVRENILFFGKLYGLKKDELKQQTDFLLQWLNLSGFANMRAENLSGGYQRLLTIACALVNNPKILFLDEPTTGLDANIRRMFWDKIRKLSESGVSVILTTHYMEEAEELCDRISIMALGEILVTETPEKLINQYGPNKVLVLTLSKHVELELVAQLKMLSPKSEVRVVGSTVIVSLEKADIHKVDEMLKSAESLGYQISNFWVREPTMEDVFVRLTGQKIGD